MPFRDAHHATGQLVKLAEDGGKGLEDLSIEEMQSVDPRITNAIYDVLGVDNSVNSRQSFGGTAPKRVKQAAQAWTQALNAEDTR